MADVQDVVIVGSGPAGLTAAVYAGRANLRQVVIEGLEAGGQLMMTTTIENFPGFREGVLAATLMGEMREQALRFGATFVEGRVIAVDLATRPFRVQTEDSSVSAKALIIATGASARLLGLPNERRLMGHGVSTCATCDGYFFRGRPIAVVGGGDSALEEAIFLTRFASHVTVIHRRDALRASKIMQARALANPKITFRWNSVVEDIRDNGRGEVGAAVLRDVRTGEVSDLPVEGVFVAIGHTPNTAVFAGQLNMTAGGYLVTHDRTRTSVPGVFACGDVQDEVYRQAITAAASGCMAAMDAERFLESEG